MRKILTLTMAVVLLLMSVPAASAKSDSRPFKGSLNGAVSFVPDGDCPNYGGLRTDSAATGNVSHLGRTEMTADHCTPAGPNVDDGRMTLNAANGDRVFIEYTGFAPQPNDEGIIVVDLEFEIVGGDGRFDGAGGGGVGTVFIVFEGFDDFEWPASWIFNGEIGY